MNIQTLNGVSSKGSFIKPEGECEMLYKFKSKDAGDLIMLGEHAEPLLRILGKEVGPKGILLSSYLGRSIELLEKRSLNMELSLVPTPTAAKATGKLRRKHPILQ